MITRSTLTLALTAFTLTLALAGCTGATEPTEAVVLDITPSGVAERDVLIQAIQSAAVIATGDQVEPTQDIAFPCQTGDGVMFMYQAAVPDDGDVDATLSRIAAVWADLGIETIPAQEELYRDVEVRDPGTGPIHNGSAAYMYAMDGQPAFYLISGHSNCVPGVPEDYFHLTRQAGMLGGE